MLQLNGTPLVVGAQLPRISAVPEFWETAGGDAAEVAALAGLHLDPWERHVLDCACGVQPDGQWSAFQVGLAAPRQNGKGSILEARELAGAFAFGERLIIHSAHEQATSSEHLRRMVSLIEGVPEFDRRVLRVRRGKGEEAIELRDDYRILFKTRTGGGGRGFTGDLVVLDEAMILLDSFMAALVPTMAARSVDGNPQMWLTGSAVDRLNAKHAGVPFSRLRRRALAGQERTAWLEYGAAGESPDALRREQLDDPEMWAQGNPGLGIRISASHIKAERGAMDDRSFAVERLGVGDWETDTDLVDDERLTPEMWRGCEDITSRSLDPVVLTFDVAPDRGSASIGSAGLRDDGLRHLELVERREGAGWVVARLVELVDTHEPSEVVCAARSPAAALISKLADKGIEVRAVSVQEHADACGRLFDDVKEQQVRHLGQDELDTAVRGAARRPLGDAWLWSRRSSDVDISPLVSLTLANAAIAANSVPLFAYR